MKQVDPFYRSKEWHRLRTKALTRDGYRCVNCGADLRGKGAARIDHKMARRKYPELALHLPNLRSLCVRCDNARHANDRAAKRSEAHAIGPDGFPIGSAWGK